MQLRGILVGGLAVAAAGLAVAGAAAAEPVQTAQAAGPEEPVQAAQAAGPEGPVQTAQAAGPEEPVQTAQAAGPDEEPAAPTPTSTPSSPPRRRGIEEIVIQAGESEAVGDFQSADSVTGFDASDLEALGAQSVADIGKFTPNLEIVTGGATTPTFFIRGVGLNDFNANSTGAVAIYQDDVPINSAALQLGTLYDMEAVNILRGPQGTGQARGASAGAIKLYSRRPTGEYGAYLRSSFGNYNFRDFEGAVEAPIWEDMLAGRFAFRLSERDGYATNRCGGIDKTRAERLGPDFDPRDNTSPIVPDAAYNNQTFCGETTETLGRVRQQNTRIPQEIRDDPQAFGFQPNELLRYSIVEGGLASRVNDLGNWAARGTLLLQPTLDMEWMLNAHGSRRDELSRLGQSHGTTALIFGNDDPPGYRPEEVKALHEAAKQELAKELPCYPNCGPVQLNQLNIPAREQVAPGLAKDLDPLPHTGDYSITGPTTNDTWGLFLKGDIALGSTLAFKTVTGYDTYDRLIDVDLDQSPNVLFEIVTDDTGWQFTQSLELGGALAEGIPLEWTVGGYYLQEELDVHITNDFGNAQFASVATRAYIQKLWSAAGYFSFAWDFWDDFTLDGGVRYNWEHKTMDLNLTQNGVPSLETADEIWQAPTGTIRLTYRFREDTHAYWKYTRGWKGGHFNATTAILRPLTPADPETIDAFETGMRGSWLDGRLNADLSLFYYNYTNYQIFTSESSYDSIEFVVLNANDAEVYGAEVDLALRPLPGMFLNARFSWLESQFLDFVQVQREARQEGLNVRLFSVDVDHSGNNLLNSPRFKLSLTAEQMIPLGRFGTLTARWDGAWSDETFFDPTEGRGTPSETGEIFLPPGTIAQKPYWLHNLRVGYRPPPGNIEIAGFVRNLTDEVYRTFAFNAHVFRNTTIHLVGEPRTYGLTFSVDF